MGGWIYPQATGTRPGIERCGKINAGNSGSESWTGIGVVTGFAAVMLITSGPHVKKMDAHHGITLLHILQEVRRIGKTRNQLELWTQEHPQFQGKYYQVSGVGFQPKPVQTPRPPIWIGGHSAPALHRAATLGDGWMPIGLRPQPFLEPAEIEGRLRGSGH